MAIKFETRSLKDENGKVYLISYKKVLEECFKHPYDTISIATIVYETIEKMTGERIIGNMHNGKPLYIWLEKHIKADERYQRQKELKVERDNRIREQRREYKKLHSHTINEKFVEKYLRDSYRKIYRH